MILEPWKVKSVTVSTFPPSVCHEVMGPDAVIFVFLMLSFKPAFPCFLPVVMTSGMACGLPTGAVSSFYVSYEFLPKEVLLKGIARQGTWWFYLAISEIRSFSQNQDFLSWELFKERPFFWRQFQKRSYWDLGSRDGSVQANWFSPRDSKAQNLLCGCRFLLVVYYRHISSKTLAF